MRCFKFFYVVVLWLVPAMSFGQSWQTSDAGFEVSGGVSTLGLYITPALRLNQSFRVRAPIYFGSFSGDFEFQDNKVKARVKMLSPSVMVDYSLGKSGAWISAGASVNGYRASASSSSLTFDGVVFNNAFSGTVEQKQRIVPVISIGYERNVGKNGFFIAGELGARLTKLRLTATGQESLPPRSFIPDGVPDVSREAFEEQVADYNKKLNNLPFLPFISLSVGFRF